MKEVNESRGLRCLIWRYNDDFFVAVTNWDMGVPLYDHVLYSFPLKGLPLKKKKCQRPAKKATIFLGIAFVPYDSIEPDHEKMIRPSVVTRSRVSKVVCRLKQSQHFSRFWNWFLSRNRPAMSVVQRCYEILERDNNPVQCTRAACHELNIQFSLCSLIHAHLDRNIENAFCSNAGIIRGLLYAVIVWILSWIKDIYMKNTAKHWRKIESYPTLTDILILSMVGCLNIT